MDRFSNTAKQEKSSASYPLILISGPLCSGKTTVADLLRDRVGAHILYVRSLLRERGATDDRQSLQEVGAELEATTGGAWLAQSASGAIQSNPAHLIVVDSVRTPKQLEHLRALSNRSVLIYLTASPTALSRRFKKRNTQGITESISYAQATSHPTERAVVRLAALADCLIDTTDSPRQQVFGRVRGFLE